MLKKRRKSEILSNTCTAISIYYAHVHACTVIGTQAHVIYMYFILLLIMRMHCEVQLLVGVNLQVSTVQDALTTLCPEGPVVSTYPLSMEEVKHVSVGAEQLWLLSHFLIVN